MTTDPARRRYESPLRAAHAEQTRATVVAVATRLFIERGWNGTGVRDVAREAHVSVETVYANFGSKAELLKQALDVAVVGDAAPVPLADRDDFRRLGQGTATERATAAGQLLATMRQRTARLRRVLNQAAGSDPQLSQLLADSLRTERESVRQGVAAVAQRPVPDEDVDALFAVLSSEVFLLLTEARGWSVPMYQAWVARTVCQHLNLKENIDGA
ncbi:MAG TPA: helix-turn-helix domain-containing protein [Trebonia sp.]|jgi:AcrR family transcriptional regulator